MRGLRLAAVAALVALIVPAASPVLAQHANDTSDPRCADWAAGSAPAGLDLTSLCVAHEVVATYTGAGSPQDPLLPYAGAALVAGMGLAFVGVLALRYGGRQVARRFEPETPSSWWVCPDCRSVNAASRTSCYACHAHAPAGPAHAADASLPSVVTEPPATRTAPRPPG